MLTPQTVGGIHGTVDDAQKEEVGYVQLPGIPARGCGLAARHRGWRSHPKTRTPRRRHRPGCQSRRRFPRAWRRGPARRDRPAAGRRRRGESGGAVEGGGGDECNAGIDLEQCCEIDGFPSRLLLATKLSGAYHMNKYRKWKYSMVFERRTTKLSNESLKQHTK